MKNSNINTVRYVLKRGDRGLPSEEGNFSASNKGIPTKTIVTNFLEGKIKPANKYISEGNQGVGIGSIDSYVYGEGSDTGTEGVSFDLAGRQARSLPKPKYDNQSEGKVVVEITVDRKPDAPRIQKGTITYHFILR